MAMTIFGPDGSHMMVVTALERSGNNLILKGQMFRGMPATLTVTPSEVRKGLRLLNLKLLWFLLTLAFRQSRGEQIT